MYHSSTEITTKAKLVEFLQEAEDLTFAVQVFFDNRTKKNSRYEAIYSDLAHGCWNNIAGLKQLIEKDYGND